MSIFASLLRGVYRLTGAKKAFALPETEIAVEASCCAGVTPASHATALQAMTACQIVIR